GAGPDCVELAGRVQVTVGRRVVVGRVGLQGMSAELLDVDLDRSGQSLRPERVDSDRLPAARLPRLKPVLATSLLAGHQRRAAQDSGGWAGEDRNPWSSG